MLFAIDQGGVQRLSSDTLLTGNMSNCLKNPKFQLIMNVIQTESSKSHTGGLGFRSPMERFFFRLWTYFRWKGWSYTHATTHPYNPYHQPPLPPLRPPIHPTTLLSPPTSHHPLCHPYHSYPYHHPSLKLSILPTQENTHPYHPGVCGPSPISTLDYNVIFGQSALDFWSYFSILGSLPNLTGNSNRENLHKTLQESVESQR